MDEDETNLEDLSWAELAEQDNNLPPGWDNPE